MTYIKRKSAKQEVRTAKEFGGRTQIASGAIDGMKADVRTGERIAGKFNSEDFLIENKYTESKAYKFTLATWDKIIKEAFRDNFRIPLMQIDVQDVQLVVMEALTAENMGFITTKYYASTGKSYSMGHALMEQIFHNSLEDEVLQVHFENTGQKIFIVLKDDFLRRLS